ncbi:MAG: hypothetical protein BWZ08_02007 [candidate division BRC1 bacterium ADurb.BinA292]|nr:MAG: hypothetical protein BWZ08_02007 [candidate division BRC1 bacterium ADurb.BinA292]
MSYDLEFFRLADGVSKAQVNDFLRSDAYMAFCKEQERLEEALAENPAEAHDMVFTTLPTRFVDTSLDEERLLGLLGRALLQRSIPPAERSPELQAWLERRPGAELPPEHVEDLSLAFEYAGTPGTQPMMFSMRGLNGALTMVAGMLEDLKEERIVVFDPQLAAIVDGDDARALLTAMGREASAIFNSLLASIDPNAADDQGADYEDADDEEEDEEDWEDDEDDEDWDDDEDWEEDEDWDGDEDEDEDDDEDDDLDDDE